MAELLSAVEALKRGFPNDDPDGHRLYHEAVIETERARKEFWQRLTFELAKWWLLGFIGWSATQLWAGFLRGKVGI